MVETDQSTIPLSVGVTIPLFLSLPCAFLLYSLYKKRNHTWSFDITSADSAVPIPHEQVPKTTTSEVQHTNKQAEGRKKASLATLDIRSFLGKLQHTRRNEANTPEMEATSPSAIPSDPTTTLSKLLKPAFTFYTASTLLSLICGAIYLSCMSSTTNYSNALNFPLGISVTCVPFVCFAYAIKGLRSSRTSASSRSTYRKHPVREQLGSGFVAPVLASIVVAALGAWVSPYIVVALLGIALSSTTIFTVHTCRRIITSQLTRVLTWYGSHGKRRRQTRLSGNGLDHDHAEIFAGRGGMPRPGEKEEDFVHRMQHEGTSWITETGE